MIEQRAVAFGNGFQPRQQVSKFLNVPAADVAQDALPVHAVGARRFAVRVGVIVMARRPGSYNIYGGNKDIDAVFGDNDRFLR